MSLLGKLPAPLPPPWGTGVAAAALSRAGVVRIPPELVNLLRFGRALDNRRMKATGYRFRYTTRETVLKLREHQRLAPLMRAGPPAYRYEEEVEEFLRWSPSVCTSSERGALGRPTPHQLGELRKVIAAVEAEGVQTNVAPGARGRGEACGGAGERGAGGSPGPPAHRRGGSLSRSELEALLVFTNASTAPGAPCWPRSTRHWTAPSGPERPPRLLK